ncbi:tyrosine-type recombinase/integrase [Agrococcus beijingensis]|uniref:tyrosine-type recombinase/integrase n=1 Tax=Agrococcus beijingensis TaxID=3068634 RepID=UPI002741E4C5|nr:tyrosine-type recombinase/integrase [Agrococcus sp. REN33]
MARPPLPPGSWGAVRYYPQPNGRVLARSRYRDHAGNYHPLRATAETAEAAERLLKSRAAVGVRDGAWITLDSRVTQLAKWWLAGLELAGRLQPGTLENYALDARHTADVFGNLRLRELTVLVVDSVLLELAGTDPRLAYRVHGTLRRMCADAARVGVLTSNPVEHVPAPQVPTSTPYTLNPEQAEYLRLFLARWLAERAKPGPRPDARIVPMVDILLATGIRIGELLALRQRDIDLEGRPPTLLVGATLIEDARGGPQWQDHPKAKGQRRRLVLPALAVDALAPLLTPEDPDRPVFPNRKGAWTRPNHVERILRSFAAESGGRLRSMGIDPDEVTPHLFRRTLATMIANEANVDRAKEQLGHASRSTTERHYITPPDVVGASAAQIVDRHFGANRR